MSGGGWPNALWRLAKWGATDKHYQSMTVLTMLARETLDVVFAGLDGALLGALNLVGQHVCLKVLEDLAAVGPGASLLLLAALIAAALARCGRDELAHAGGAGAVLVLQPGAVPLWRKGKELLVLII